MNVALLRSLILGDGPLREGRDIALRCPRPRAAGGTSDSTHPIARLNAARTAQRAVPTRFMRSLAVWITLISPLVAHAHLGSPNVYFEGPAGPYPIRVVI